MGDKYLTLSELNLKGEFLGLLGNKPGEYKYLQLAVPAGNLQIKIPKHLGRNLSLSLVPGEMVSVWGVSQLNRKNGQIKFKAHQVTSVDVDGCVNQKPRHPEAKIMVCQKSGCWKRGGKGLLSDLEKTLCDRGLLDKVKIERTGCQKKCNNAPNCVLQLGKKKYKKVPLETIASLLESHLQQITTSVQT